MTNIYEKPNEVITSNIQDEKSLNGFHNELKQFAKQTDKVKSKLKNVTCPIEVLPPKTKRFVQELAEKQKFSPHLTLSNILFVTSVCGGNNYRIVVKQNWYEPINIYIAIVALPGQTKTPVQSLITKVLREKNRELYKEFSKKLEEYEEAKRMSSKDSPFNEQKPIRKQVLIQDSTQEATIKVLSHNRRGVGILFDELSALFANANRYNNGSEIQFYLSAFNTQSYTSNRKTSDDVFLPDPFISIAGNIPPGILINIFKGEFQENGLKDRELFCFPNDLKKEVPTDEEVDRTLIEHYESTLKFIYDDSDKRMEQSKSFSLDENYIEVPFSNEARQLLFQYLQTNADEVNDYNSKAEYSLAGTFSKFDYHVIRLSFLIQLLTDAEERRQTDEISIDSVQKGIKLSDYFKWNALRVHALISGDPLAHLDKQKRNFYDELPDGEFPLSDALAIAKSVRYEDKLTEDSIKKWAERFLNSNLFTKPKHGIYIKN